MKGAEERSTLPLVYAEPPARRCDDPRGSVGFRGKNLGSSLGAGMCLLWSQSGSCWVS